MVRSSIILELDLSSLMLLVLRVSNSFSNIFYLLSIIFFKLSASARERQILLFFILFSAN